MRIQESICLGVSLVLQFIDEFTGRPVLGTEIRVGIPRVQSPLRKPEGYYIFTDVPGEQATVTVESLWYSPGNFDVPIRKEKAPLNVQKIRLFPTAAHPIAGEASCVYGKARPGEMILACCPEGGGYRKLLLDGKKGGETLAIYSQEDENLEGSCFYLMEGNGGKGEVVELGSLEGLGSGSYQLKAPLKGDYKKIGTKLCILRRTRADDKGNYFLPLSRGGSGSREYLFWRQWEDKKDSGGPTARTLSEGVRSRLDWEEGL